MREGPLSRDYLCVAYLMALQYLGRELGLGILQDVQVSRQRQRDNGLAKESDPNLHIIELPEGATHYTLVGGA